MARSYVFVIAKPTSHPWGVVSDAEMMAPVSQDSTEHSPVVTEERDAGKHFEEAARDKSALEVQRVVGDQGKKRLMSNCSSLSQNRLFFSPLQWSVTDPKIHPAQGHWPSHTF